MEYQVKGNDLQMLEVRLAKGEAVYTESGGMAWMSHGVGMETNTRGGLLSSAMPRM